MLGTLSIAANADPIVYEIESYSTGNYSASWLHQASNCSGAGPDTGLPLCMSGGGLQSIFGTIEGDLVAGLLTITGGQLSIGGTAYDVLGGFLGAFGDGNIWSIDIESHGRFLFENIAMGSAGPNSFDGQELILWGQNIGAYYCAQNQCVDNLTPWGIDLYGKAVAVPEPSTLILFGFGLLGIGFAKRKA